MKMPDTIPSRALDGRRGRPWWCVIAVLGLLTAGCVQLCNGLPVELARRSDSDSHNQLLTGLVAFLLTVCSIVCLAGCLCCQRRNGFKEFRDSPVAVSMASNLDRGHVNPLSNGGPSDNSVDGGRRISATANGGGDATEFTIFTPLSAADRRNASSGNNVFAASQQIIARIDDDCKMNDVDLTQWFNSGEKDFPRTQLKYIQELGKGWFGRVVEGTAQGLTQAHNDWRPVVVRILEATASAKQRAQFLHDAAIYRTSGGHSNLLKLEGRCLDTVPLLLLQEYCSQGDLKQYLRTQKVNAQARSAFLSSEYPLLWCCQLATALKHLHDHRIPHPDLATRNCQLDGDMALKLGDYGTAVSKYPDDYYHGSDVVPVRWCSPESVTFTPTTIQSKQMTVECNIWSLGVCMWEIFELAQLPYDWLSNDEVVSQVLGPGRVRLPKPTCKLLYTDYIYRLMQLCWSTVDTRPAITQIDLMLLDLLQVYRHTNLTGTAQQHPVSSDSASTSDADAPMSLQSFDERWTTFKPNTIVKRDNHNQGNDGDIDDDDEEDTHLIASTIAPSGVGRTSASLRNLAGSLDNLLGGAASCSAVSSSAGATHQQKQLDSWLENVASSTGDLAYVQGLSDALHDLDSAIALENVSSSSGGSSAEPSRPNSGRTDRKATLQFKLGPIPAKTAHNYFNSSQSGETVTSGQQQPSLPPNMSESESEGENNWRRMIERGAYTEKVRQKSRSVADLMVLTHIDNSESSDSETGTSVGGALSIEMLRGQQHERNSLLFGSEGNLLEVANTFEQELRQLQIERRDSLLFVPDSQRNRDRDGDFESSGGDQQQVYSVYNVNVTSPTMQIVSAKSELHAIINLCDDEKLEKKVALSPDIVTTPKANMADTCAADLLVMPDIISSCNGIDGQTTTTESSSSSSTVDQLAIDDESPLESVFVEVPRLTELIESNAALMDYIIDRYEAMNGKIDLNESSPLVEARNDTLIAQHDSNLTRDHVVSVSQRFVDDLLVEAAAQCDERLRMQDQELPPPPTPSSSVILGACDDYTIELYSGLKTAANSERDGAEEEKGAPFSLATWDQFLGGSFDEYDAEDVQFSQPQSLLFVVAECGDGEDVILNRTFDVPIEVDVSTEDAGVMNSTYDLVESEEKSVELGDIHLDVTLDDSSRLNESADHQWQYGNGGWFLHPQDGAEPSGAMDLRPEETANDSYVGFSMDDEIMAAIRNELLIKLPHAQRAGSGSEPHDEPEENTDNSEYKEMVMRYNIYSTALPTIPEESLSELLNSGQSTPNCTINTDTNDSDSEESNWSEPALDDPLQLPDDDDEAAGAAPSHMPPRHHTPSQDSCCSNDTLFNLDELQSNEKDLVNAASVDTSPLSPVQSVDVICDENPEELDGDKIGNIDEVSVAVPTAVPDLIESAASSSVSATVSPPLKSPSPTTPTTTTTTTSSCGVPTLTIIDACALDDTIEEDEERLGSLTVTTATSSSDAASTSTTATTQLLLQHQQQSSPSLSLVACFGSGAQMIVPPLNSPEDRPWKHIAATLSTVTQQQSPETCIIIPSCDDDDDNAADEIVDHEYLESAPSSDIGPVLVDVDDDAEGQHDYDCVAYEKYDYVQNDTAVKNLVIRPNEDTYAHYDYAVYNEVDRGDNITAESCRRPSLDHEYVNEALSPDLDVGPEEPIAIPLGGITFSGPGVSNTTSCCPLPAIDVPAGGAVMGVLDLDEEYFLEAAADDRERLGDLHLMSTSFSDSADLGDDDQDWDSGSDTRSSSSGEFIWKEGEHEASVKALHAAPDTHSERIMSPLDEIQEEEDDDEHDDDDVDAEESSSGTDDGDGIEFVPSAWDRFAMPTKSAIRSPERRSPAADADADVAAPSNSQDSKSRNVWFKKQKYHCIYEYPREPESPVLQSYDLWQPSNEYAMCPAVVHHAFVLPEPLVSSTKQCRTTCDDLTHDDDVVLRQTHRPPISVPDFTTDEDFYMRGSSGHVPLDQLLLIATANGNKGAVDPAAQSVYGGDLYTSTSGASLSGASSQFFPGGCWMMTGTGVRDINNTTPDSGAEDVTPASLSETSSSSEIVDYTDRNCRTPMSLKTLAERASDPCLGQSTDGAAVTGTSEIGGLRHTRNRLKLDLPPSPSAFTANKGFVIEDEEDEPIVKRRPTPTFTTFGKSRFTVQQVKTPSPPLPPDGLASSITNMPFPASSSSAADDERGSTTVTTPTPNQTELILLHNHDDDDKTSSSSASSSSSSASSSAGGGDVILRMRDAEIVRGEASLLDSADEEDSGIESCTLERHKSRTERSSSPRATIVVTSPAVAVE